MEGGGAQFFWRFQYLPMKNFYSDHFSKPTISRKMGPKTVLFFLIRLKHFRRSKKSDHFQEGRFFHARGRKSVRFPKFGLENPENLKNPFSEKLK